MAVALAPAPGPLAAAAAAAAAAAVPDGGAGPVPLPKAAAARAVEGSGALMGGRTAPWGVKGGRLDAMAAADAPEKPAKGEEVVFMDASGARLGAGAGVCCGGVVGRGGRGLPPMLRRLWGSFAKAAATMGDTGEAGTGK